MSDLPNHMIVDSVISSFDFSDDETSYFLQNKNDEAKLSDVIKN